MINYIKALRPKQWIKNGIVFVPILFSGHFTLVNDWKLTIIAFILISLLASGTYILNDIQDIEHDKLHPVKSLRPIASWKVHKTIAFILAIVLISGSIAFSFLVLQNTLVWAMLIAYLINTVLYTYFLKHIVLVDVFSIATGFVLRGLIWAFAISVEPSIWLFMILFFWALWLGFLKRYQEVKLWINTRKNIASYNELLLQQIISMITSVIIVAYSLYTFQSTQPRMMVITLPLVVFGVIRYYYNIFSLEKYEDGIENIILKDYWILGTIFVYITSVVLIVVK